jgi:hypothetical protein
LTFHYIFHYISHPCFWWQLAPWPLRREDALHRAHLCASHHAHTHTNPAHTHTHTLTHTHTHTRTHEHTNTGLNENTNTLTRLQKHASLAASMFLRMHIKCKPIVVLAQVFTLAPLLSNTMFTSSKVRQRGHGGGPMALHLEVLIWLPTSQVSTAPARCKWW